MSRATRRAGISIPLFSLRSTASWGIGEIGDIPAFARWMRAAGLSVLQILPLNELAGGETSPYSALSAMSIDPQFISIGMVEGGDELERDWVGELQAVRRSSTIQYAAVRRLKRHALRALFDRFFATEWTRETEKAARMAAFIEAESWWLDSYSLFRALRAREDRPWLEWPEELRDARATALEKARVELSTEILYIQYLQWLAAEQWTAVRHGAAIEILGDFPFMVTLDSADVWSRRDDFMLDASVGTPPDAFSETGQEWGLPPYNWDRAREDGFAWLCARARRQASIYDGFRLDHLVGFYRTYVRPLDKRPPYFMPATEDDQRELGETVMRIMLETASDVSAEDLGTVPDFVRASIARLGIPGYKVLRWESGDPSTYPPLSVAMTGTHDTEPVAAWWDTLAPADRRRFASTEAPFDDAIRDAILQRMLGAGSNLVLLPLQDIFGWRDRINQPATISSSNWSYTLPWPVDRLSDVPDAVERASRFDQWTRQAGRRAEP